jgi:hypothetical protein
MNLRGRSEDLSTLLYMVPFIASGVYGLALWIQSGISLVLPASVYLTVTRDPVLFIVGSLSVVFGLLVEMDGTNPAARSAKLASLGNTLQSIAIASLVLVVICALYANGFTNLGGAVTDFIVGKYGLVFPATLVLLSYFVTARFRVEAITSRRVAAMIALLLVPVSLYEIGKRQTALGLGVALLFLVLGVALYLLPQKSLQKEK